jgi:uncharacterized protein (DUF1778 family)
MGQTADTKRNRVYLRLNAATKAKLERATAYEATTVSNFVLTNAVATVERVIATHENLTLSGQDWDLFHDALLNPPEPNVMRA